MKVLSVNKFFYPKGGSETHFFNLNNLLDRNGVEIIPFSMKDEKNLPSGFEPYFVDNINYSCAGLRDKIRYSFKIIYSFEAKRKIQKLIDDTKPDLAHLHVFQHQLSPSILKTLKDNNIPVVNTVHDLKLMCPNYKMIKDGRICEKCKVHKYYQCFLNRCVKNSRAGSLVNTVEMYLHWLLGSYALVDVFITPSRFLQDKLVEYGFPQEKLVYIPNFVDASLYTPNYASGNYFLYFGRLSEEKGVFTLLQAMKTVTGIDLYIAGDGPLKERIAGFIRENRLEQVKCFGYMSGKELDELIRNSKFTVLPSEVYENSPLSVLEAMAFGKPVIGSDTGGIPELVLDKITGLLFTPGNAEELADRIRFLTEHPERVREMGEEARARVEAEYNGEVYYKKLSAVYERLLRVKGESYGRIDRCNV